MAPDLRAYTIAQQLLECACDALAETEAGCPDRSCVTTGALAWDCDCAQLTVALGSVYPSANFPTQAATTAAQFGAAKCGHPIKAYTYTVSILRCVPSVDDTGNPPSCEDLDSSAQVTISDAAAIMAAIECCLVEMYDTRDEQGRRLIMGWTVGTQTMVGPQGMCGGSALPVTVGVVNNCPCPP